MALVASAVAMRRLRRHDVGDDGRAADARALDEGDVGPELGAREGGLVSAGPTPEYGDPLLALEFIGHASYSLASGIARRTAPMRDRGRAAAHGVSQ